MSSIRRFVRNYSRRSRLRRRQVFRERFWVTPRTRILDFGSGPGDHVASLLEGADYTPRNVYIADIDERAVNAGARRYGFRAVPLTGEGKLPFGDGFFDIVFCSSMIEHYTLPKSEIWLVRSESDFCEAAWPKQQECAREVQRVGRNYFVQTPNKWFPIESHTWLPFVGYAPRWLLIGILRVTNRLWVKSTQPDWHLLNKRQMKVLFPGAEILLEKSAGFTKSLIAVKSADHPDLSPV